MIYPSWINVNEIKDGTEVKSAEDPAIPINPRRMWPALILAASRNERVIKRTEILIVSVKTKKGFNQSGAPLGRKWATKDLGAWTIALIINLNQRGRPKDKVKRRCLVDLNTYGSNPRRFNAISITKRETRIEGNPFKWILNVREAWEFITSTGKVGIQEKRENLGHREDWSREIEKKDKDQKINGDKELEEHVAGSNEEKMSAIIKDW